MEHIERCSLLRVYDYAYLFNAKFNWMNSCIFLNKDQLLFYVS